MWAVFIVHYCFFMSLQVLHHLRLVEGRATTQRSSYRDVRHLLPILLWTFGLLPCPALTQSHAACHLLWRQPLTFVAGGSRVSLLVFSTHAGSLRASSSFPTSSPFEKILSLQGLPWSVELRCLCSAFKWRVVRASSSSSSLSSITDTPISRKLLANCSVVRLKYRFENLTVKVADQS